MGNGASVKKVNYIGKLQERHPNDHKLNESFIINGELIKGYIVAICPECESKTAFSIKGIKSGLNRFSISCKQCGGWRNMEFDYRMN